MMEELKIWLEKRFQCDLPQSYYELLLSGKIQEYKDLSFCFMEDGVKTSADIHLWYAYDKDAGYEDTYSLYLKNGVISKNYFPIGEDSLGDLICFYLGKRNHGAVYFVNHELFSGNPIKVNDSFEEFIQGLGNYDDLDIRPVQKKQEGKEITEDVSVNREQYVAFFQGLKKKLPDKLFDVLEERGGEYVAKRINFKDHGTEISWILRSFLDFSESMKQYKECQEIKSLKNNYLPFMQSIIRKDYFCIKCGGKYVGTIYAYDGFTGRLDRAYGDIEEFLRELENGPFVELES